MRFGYVHAISMTVDGYLVDDGELRSRSEH
jgi:hypothetical protein